MARSHVIVHHGIYSLLDAQLAEAEADMSGCSQNPNRMRLAGPPERSYAGSR